MPPTDVSERGLESLIVDRLTGLVPPLEPTGNLRDERELYRAGGYVAGSPADYDRLHAVDVAKLLDFLRATQPRIVEQLDLETDGPSRLKFLDRLQGEIAKKGVIEVLRQGVKHGPAQVDCFYGNPTPGNVAAAERFAVNVFSVTRQVRYSPDETARALDLVLFINGLPVATFELKNSLTKQTVADAVKQYRADRDPRELLFRPKRCIVHFAVDDQRVEMCTELQGKASWFLPFDKGWNDGAGNPRNPRGLKTAYLWEEVLSRESLTGIIENYAQVVVENDEKGQKRERQVFPRYHQLDVVRKLLAHADTHGAGHRYLIQHSAGSGKSNSIAWLAHQLIDLQLQAHPSSGMRLTGDPVAASLDPSPLALRTLTGGDIGCEQRPESQKVPLPAHRERGWGEGSPPVDGRGRQWGEGSLFDTVVVVTDRRILDKQIRDTIKQFTHVAATVGEAKNSGDLRRFIEGGKRIVVSTIQKFPMILDEIGDQHRNRRFAIVIDEAHSSQGGKSTSAMSGALGSAFASASDDGDDTYEDEINRIMASRTFLANASYFAFTATPKNKTLELFGEPVPGTPRRRPFHSYTMKQAIEEGFIVDVLGSYTPIQSYYRLVKTVAGDPEFDTKRAGKKLRRYVEEHDDAIRAKAEIMADHFHDRVIGQHKIGGQARAMVVTDGVERAIAYWQALSGYLSERNSPYKAIIAFSGEREVDGIQVSEARLNRFPSADIPDRFRQDPYRFLVVADKFQTGYDEPLLHTMYVDKMLSGIKAVQTLSRLNRAHPHKHDTFVLDFRNDAEMIQASFAPYYRTTVLSGETDPNKLHDLKTDLDARQVYAAEDVETLVQRFLDGAPRDQLDPVLDKCVAVYLTDLDEDAQVDFKGKAKTFTRTYAFLAAILPYTNAEWEKLSIFLNLLIPKLPAPREDDLSQGILEAIDLDSYRAEVRASTSISLADEEGDVNPIPGGGAGGISPPELELLSEIIRGFNDLFGNISWADEDKIRKVLAEELPAKVLADPAYQNAIRNSDKQNARVEHDRVLRQTIAGMVADHSELYKQFEDNPSFKQWLGDMIFNVTYQPPDPA